jgi:nicotinate phosphoribosyltransferase
LLDKAGFPDVKILASNELDEHIIESVRKKEGRIDAYGVGTRLVTAAGRAGGALNGVYKLVELDGLPRIKVSSDRAKSTIPGCKKIWRVSRDGGDDRFEMDVLAGFVETPRPGDLVFDPSNPLRHTRIPRTAQIRDLRTAVMKDGNRTQPGRPLDEIAGYARQRLSQLPDGCRRLLNPHTYRVTMSQNLNERRARMIEEAAPQSGNGGPAEGREP